MPNHVSGKNRKAIRPKFTRYYGDGTGRDNYVIKDYGGQIRSMNGHRPAGSRRWAGLQKKGMKKSRSAAPKFRSTKGTLESDNFNGYISWQNYSLDWRKRDLSLDPNRASLPVPPPLTDIQMRRTYDGIKKGGRRKSRASARSNRGGIMLKNNPFLFKPKKGTKAKTGRMSRCDSSKGDFILRRSARRSKVDDLSIPKSVVLNSLDGMLKKLNILKRSGRFSRIGLKRQSIEIDSEE